MPWSHVTRATNDLADRPDKPYPATFLKHGMRPLHSMGLQVSKIDPASGPPGNRTPITCMQNRRLTIGQAAPNCSARQHAPERFLLESINWLHDGEKQKHSEVIGMGVEPTKSPRPQRDRFSCLRTRSKLRIRGSHPACLAYEA